MLNKAGRENQLTGLPVASKQIQVNHLLFTDDCMLFCKASSVEWSRLIHILGIYETASGQRMNKEKSSLFFSKNTQSSTKDSISCVAGVRTTNSCEKYLGLPNLIGKSRNKGFREILGKVRAKMSNWQMKLLSQAGREILIKSLLQGIPTYAMGVFKFPKGLLQQLNRLMANYWWGQNNQDRKISWLSWAQLGKSKNIGGLGFCDFENFNLAMLAKQGWRILKHPNSLVSKILQTKYFPNSKFLKAKLGTSPSFIWRSLLSARELMQQGLIWRIGNGSSVRIGEDPWIPQPHLFKPQSGRNLLGRGAKVDTLIQHETSEWNIRLIKTVFSSQEAYLITQIPISNCRQYDQLMWRGTTHGDFTVRSAYHLQGDLQYRNQAGTSSKLFLNEEWCKLWKLPISLASKNFLWRACRNILPTKENLCKKKILKDSTCPMCLQQPETVEHILWNCVSASDVWSVSSRKIQKSLMAQSNIKQIMQVMQQKLDKEEMIEFTLTLWNLWWRRNQLVFKNIFIEPQQVIYRVKQLRMDLAAAVNTKRQGNNNSESSGRVIWECPPKGYCKINWDVAVESRLCKIGIGVAVRDDKGNFLATMRKKMTSIPDPLLAEARAALEA